MIVGVIQQKGVVPRVAVDLGVGDMAPVVQEGENDLARTCRCKAPVGREAGDKKAGTGARQGGGKIALVGVGRIEIVELLSRNQIGIGVEEAGELVALITQVGFCLLYTSRCV